MNSEREDKVKRANKIIANAPFENRPPIPYWEMEQLARKCAADVLDLAKENGKLKEQIRNMQGLTLRDIENGRIDHVNALVDDDLAHNPTSCFWCELTK